MDERKDFLPIILGSDENAYGTVRLFREAYGVRPLILCTSHLIPTTDSVLFDLIAIPHFDSDEVFVRELKAILTEKKQEYRHLLVIPCSDYYTHLVSVHADAFDGLIANPQVSSDLLARLETKDRFYALCEEHGLAYPKTVIVSADERREADPEALGLSYPIVLKPDNSNGYAYRHCYFDGWKKVYFLNTPDEYRETTERFERAGYPGSLILQEFIPGGDDAMRVMNCYSDQNGKVRQMCLGQPVLEEYAPNTVGNYAAIVSRYDEKLYRQIECFLNAIGYVGFSNFDLKYDSRTGRYLLFEINARPGRSSYFVRAAGLNLMQVMTEDVIYGKTPAGVIYGEAVSLWTAVPKGILRRYVKNEILRKEVLSLWRQGSVTRTLFAPEETKLCRKLRILRYYYSYYKNFRNYYFDKEEKILRQHV